MLKCEPRIIITYSSVSISHSFLIFPIRHDSHNTVVYYYNCLDYNYFYLCCWYFPSIIGCCMQSAINCWMYLLADNKLTIVRFGISNFMSKFSFLSYLMTYFGYMRSYFENFNYYNVGMLTVDITIFFIKITLIFLLFD